MGPITTSYYYHHLTETDISDEHICRPYNLQAVHNLFALLVDLLNPETHQESVIKVSMNLLTVALETGGDFLHACPSILQLVATDMTKYIMMLLYRDRISLFATTLRLAFLLFEALRFHLKLQLEVWVHSFYSIGGISTFYLPSIHLWFCIFNRSTSNV